MHLNRITILSSLLPIISLAAPTPQPTGDSFSSLSSDRSIGKQVPTNFNNGINRPAGGIPSTNLRNTGIISSNRQGSGAPNRGLFSGGTFGANPQTFGQTGRLGFSGSSQFTQPNIHDESIADIPNPVKGTKTLPNLPPMNPPNPMAGGNMGTFGQRQPMPQFQPQARPQNIPPPRTLDESLDFHRNEATRLGTQITDSRASKKNLAPIPGRAEERRINENVALQNQEKARIAELRGQRETISQQQGDFQQRMAAAQRVVSGGRPVWKPRPNMEQNGELVPPYNDPNGARQNVEVANIWRKDRAQYLQDVKNFEAAQKFAGRPMPNFEGMMRGQ